MAKVKLLYLPSDTDPMNPLAITDEKKAIDASIEKAKGISVEVVEKKDVKLPELAQLAADHRPRVVHVNAHGKLDGASTNVMLFNAQGKVEAVDQARMTTVLRRFGEEGARLVVLGVCQSLPLAEALIADKESKIDAVISMSGDIRSNALPAFSGALHGALARGEPLQKAYEAALVTLAGPLGAIPKLRCRKGVDPKRWYLSRRSLVAWIGIPVLAAAALAVILAWLLRPDPYLACMEERLKKIDTPGDKREMAKRFRADKGKIDASEERLDDTLVKLAMKPIGWQALVECGKKESFAPEMEVKFDVVIDSDGGDVGAKEKPDLSPRDPKRLSAHNARCEGDGRCQVRSKITDVHQLSELYELKRPGHQSMTLTLREMLAKKRIALGLAPQPVPVPVPVSTPTTTGTHRPEPPPLCGDLDLLRGLVRSQLRAGEEATVSVEVKRDGVVCSAPGGICNVVRAGFAAGRKPCVARNVTVRN